MQVHLWYRHVRYTVVILEECNLPQPRCPLCDMLVPCRDMNGIYRGTAQFKKGTERKRRRLEVEEEREVTSRAVSTYGHPLEMVTSFKYLGKVISAADNYWPEVVRNLTKA